MLTTFCTGYAMGMATVGVAIILVDNYLNPKTDKPEIKLPEKVAAHFERKANEMLKKESKPKVKREIKPMPVPKVEIVKFEDFFFEDIEEPVIVEEEFTLDDIIEEFK